MKRPLIDGWTTDEEASELAALAKGKRVLEVGTFKGLGAVLMIWGGAEEVWAVDWHRGDAALGPQDTLCTWWTNIRRYQVADQVVGLVGRSATVLPLLRPESFDLAFVDADHEEEAVSVDIMLTLPLVRPGGQLVFHDYSPSWPGVVAAVDRLRAAHDCRFRGSLAILTK